MAIDYEKRVNLQIFQELVRLTERFNQVEKAALLENKFTDLYTRYSAGIRR